MSLNYKNKFYLNFYNFFELSYILILLISTNNNHFILCTLIKIPFKISQKNLSSKQNINQMMEDSSFNIKLFSLINIGNPPQIIETSFNLGLSNYFISN